MEAQRQLDYFRRVREIEQSGIIPMLVWEGINVWLLFRLELLNKVLGGEERSKFSNRDIYEKSGIRSRLAMRLYERKIFGLLSEKLKGQRLDADLVLVAENDRHERDYSGTFINAYLDPYRDLAEASGIDVLRMYGWRKRSVAPNSIEHVMLDDAKEIQDYLWYGEQVAKWEACGEIWDVAERLDVDVKRVMTHAVHVLQWMKLLDPWMAKQPVQSFGVINYHNPFAMALIEVARKHGKTTFDIQHGKQGELNFSYSSFGKSIPAQGSLLPDGIWSWNTDSAQNIRAGGHDFRCAIGGNAWLNQNREGQVSGLSESVWNWLERLKRAERSLLFCAQPQKDYVLPPFLLEFARQHPEIEIGVRFHPRQNPDEEEGIDELEELPNVNVREATSVFLFAALKHVDIVATRWSTVALEARCFGKRAWIVDPFGAETFAGYIASGQMTAAIGLKGWEDALNAPEPSPMADSIAPHRSTDQYRACFEFLMAPDQAAPVFEPA